MAKTISCESNLSVTLSNGMLTIAGSGAMKDFKDFDEVCWKDDAESITAVTITGVTAIGNFAFSFCSKLTSVNVKSEITAIGRSSFAFCESLKSINIPDSVTSIAEEAFYYCSSLSLKLPSGITKIEESAFFYCSSLTSITIPNGVHEIEPFVFAHCSALASIVIPNSVTTIKESAFYDCPALASITIPSSVTTIGTDAFSDCSSLTSGTFGAVSWSLNKASGEMAFTGAGEIVNFDDTSSRPWDASRGFIKKVSFSEGITKIGKSAFSFCSSLASIAIPESIQTIGIDAFKNCSSLKTVSFQGSATRTSWNSFYGCSSLKSGKLGLVEWMLNDETGELLFTGDGEMMELYSKPWDASLLLVKKALIKGVKTISNNMFAGCTSLEEVEIPESVTAIGESAFAECSSLTSVLLPSSITGIGRNAFSDCSSLTSITIPDSVTAVGESAFYSCSNLRSVTVSSKITAIGGWTFSSCSSLSSILIPDQVKTIGNGAFSHCTSLSAVVVGQGVDSIESGAFLNSCMSVNVYFTNTEKVSGLLPSLPSGAKYFIPIGSSLTEINGKTAGHFGFLSGTLLWSFLDSTLLIRNFAQSPIAMKVDEELLEHTRTASVVRFFGQISPVFDADFERYTGITDLYAVHT